MTKIRGLGKGLSALIGENSYQLSDDDLKELDINLIEPNPDQPRTHYNENELEELSLSIRSKGVLQPIIIKSIANGKYQIIAGERRWRAAKKANLQTIPTIIKNYSDSETLEVALIENIQREDLSPIEEAEAYRKLIELHGYTQEKMAEIVNKSRSHITNLLRILNLPDIIKTYLSNDLLSLGHVKLLINLEDNIKIADEIIKRGLSVRESEELIKTLTNKSPSTKQIKPSTKPIKDDDVIMLEQALNEALGVKVAIKHTSKNGGVINISFNNVEELDYLIQKLTNSLA